VTFFIRLYKITALIMWSLFVAILTVPYQFIGGWYSVKKISRFTQLWSKGMARIINLRVSISGDIPDVSGGLVVSNHVSYLDILMHGSIMPLRHAPKSDIGKWPFLGWYIGLSRPIWIDRTSKQSSKAALRDYAETLKRGMHLIVYPEGTTTDGKSGILPFKSAPFEAAANGDAPILPVITRYRQTSGAPDVCWYGDMKLLPHAWQVLKRPSIEAELRFLPPILPAGRSRKELASFVHGVMLKEYEKSVETK
jgi:1-acyl-sn-glycerol-3-phosphate acyltransferase